MRRYKRAAVDIKGLAQEAVKDARIKFSLKDEITGTIEELLDWLVEDDGTVPTLKPNWEDNVTEAADSMVDIYYSGLKKWLCEDEDAFDEIEDYISELGIPEPFDMWKLIGGAQFLMYERALFAVMYEVEKLLPDYIEEEE